MTSRNVVEIPSGEVPTRDQIALEDTWDLSQIYPTEGDWEADADRMPGLIETVGELPWRARRVGYATTPGTRRHHDPASDTGADPRLRRAAT